MPEALALFLSADELAARNLIRDRFGVDVARTYQFWESAVARIVAGDTTTASCPWDVEVDYFGQQIRIEVKFSQEFTCNFGRGARQVYKFAEPKGGGKAKEVDAIVFVGIDANDGLDAWVAPASSIGHVRSITVTVPRCRTGTDRSVLGGVAIPLDQLLPEVLRAYRCHLHYDRDHHRETAAATRRAAIEAAGQLALIEVAA